MRLNTLSTFILSLTLVTIQDLTAADDSCRVSQCNLKGNTSPVRPKCTGSGVNHFTTFDGLRYNYQGTCPVIALKPLKRILGSVTNDFYVVTKSSLQTNSQRFSSFDYVEVKTVSHAFRLNKNLSIEVNGVLKDLPYVYPPSFGDSCSNAKQSPCQVVITKQPTGYLSLNLELGLAVTFNGNEFTITLPEGVSFFNNTGGLCGYYNGDSTDDLRRMNKTTTDNFNLFGSSWLDSTDDKTCQTFADSPPFTCSSDQSSKAEKLCYTMVQSPGPFAVCANVTDPQWDMIQSYEDCTFDLCALDLSVTARCQLLQNYGKKCQSFLDHSKAVDWQNIGGCALQCPPNSVYRRCVNTCDMATCTLVRSRSCSPTCIDGCSCAAGYVMSGKNCILPSQCAGTVIYPSSTVSTAPPPTSTFPTTIASISPPDNNSKNGSKSNGGGSQNFSVSPANANPPTVLPVPIVDPSGNSVSPTAASNDTTDYYDYYGETTAEETLTTPIMTAWTSLAPGQTTLSTTADSYDYSGDYNNADTTTEPTGNPGGKGGYPGHGGGDNSDNNQGGKYPGHGGNGGGNDRGGDNGNNGRGGNDRGDNDRGNGGRGHGGNGDNSRDRNGDRGNGNGRSNNGRNGGGHSRSRESNSHERNSEGLGFWGSIWSGMKQIGHALGSAASNLFSG